MSTWDALDSRLLRWLLEQEDRTGWFTTIINLPLRPTTEPVAEFDSSVDSRELHEALCRLESHGLIEGKRGDTLGGAHWARLRVRATGMIVLGKWPDLDRAASASGLTEMLARVAQSLDGDDKQAVQQTAGAVSRLGDSILSSVLESAGENLAG